MPKDKKTFPEFDPADVPNYVDWRLVENRLEAITRVTHFRYLTGDLDHSHSGIVTADIMDLDNEQKAWFAFLFGHSYRTQNASIIMQKFPEIMTMKPEHMLKWMEAKTGLPDGLPPLNGNRMIYGNDTKWNRWRLHTSLESIQKWLDGDSLYNRLSELVTTDSTKKNRLQLERAISSWKQFGWMSTWLTLQMLWDFFRWDIDTWRMPFPQNWSSYNGLMYVFGREELMATKEYKPSTGDVALAQSFLSDLKDYMHDFLPYKPDSFSIESVLCEYRKTAFGPRVKEYTGWTTSELAVQYEDWRKWWVDSKDVALAPIIAGLMTRSKIVRGVGYSKKYFRIVYETGMLQNVDLVFDDMPDVYEHLDVPHPQDLPLCTLWSDWKEAVSSQKDRAILYRKYAPAKRLNWTDESEYMEI